jgi:hypothetical protein
MAILSTLINAQVPAVDAFLLDQHYGNANDVLFSEAIEKIAQAIIEDMPQDLIPPAFEPWQAIMAFILTDTATNTIKERFEKSLLSFTDEIRNAIRNTVQVFIDEYTTWKSNNKKISGQNHDIVFYIRTLGRLGYKFRLNLCDDHLEVNGEQISDWKASEIRASMRALGFKHPQEIEDAYMAYAGRNGYHPVKEYLQGCRYDGGQHIEALAKCFTDEYQMIDTWLIKWLVGSIAKVMGNHQNRMLVLDGPQGVGKSSFVKWLAGGIPFYFHEGSIDTFNRKDTEVKLMSTWIWEVGELGGTMQKAEMNALKAILSQTWVKVRKAYGRHEVNKPAMASFIGTINNEAGFLNDFTGSRRYMVSKITKIDWSYTQLRVDDIWAQAMFLYQNGYQWTLDDGERSFSDEINDVYTVEDPTQAAILKYFEIDSNEQGWFFSTLDIAMTIEEKGLHYGSSNAAMMAVGRALAALGLTRARLGPKNGKREMGYRGIKPKSYGFP